MAKRITFTVYGEPKAQPRVKARVIAGHGGVYTPATANDWKASVKSAALTAAESSKYFPTLRDQAVAIELNFAFRRPASHIGKRGLKPSAPANHTKKPDIDNTIKAVADSLVDCGVLFDDAAICEIRATKSYCLDTEAPGVEITLEVLDD